MAAWQGGSSVLRSHPRLRPVRAPPCLLPSGAWKHVLLLLLPLLLLLLLLLATDPAAGV